MFARVRLALLLPLAALLGCGSSSPTSQSSSTTPTTPIIPTAPAYDFNGGWTAVTTLNPSQLPFQTIGGPLQVSNGTVTGTLTTNSSFPNDYYLCPTVWTPTNPGTTLTASGTLDANHNLTLTFPIAGGTGTLLAALSDNPGIYAFGTWQVVGGSCPMSVTPMEIKGTPTTPYTAPSPASITESLSGNWAVGSDYVFASNNPVAVRGFGAALQFSNGSVTGTILPYANPLSSVCYYNLYPNVVVAVTGTLDSNNNLTLTAPVASGTATITATLGSNLQTLADASYQISGGGCAMSATPATIAQYAPLSGTYTGTFNYPNGSTNIPVGSDSTVTLILTQSTTANANGGYPVTGTFITTGACTDSGTLVPSTASGGGISPTSNGTVSAGTATIYGNLTPAASTILYATFSSSKCAGWYYGNLVRQ